jgi:hypothetical protein
MDRETFQLPPVTELASEEVLRVLRGGLDTMQWQKDLIWWAETDVREQE